jgi:hypothetical protein
MLSLTFTSLWLLHGELIMWAQELKQEDQLEDN